MDKIFDGIVFTLTEDGIIDFVMDFPSNNLMTNEFLTAFEDYVENCRKEFEDKPVKGMIISGKGRHFSSGADVPSLIARFSGYGKSEAETADVIARMKKQKDAFTSLYNLPYPVVSAVSGFCAGSGGEIAVNSHFRVCEENARIGQPEATFGILPALGGITRTAEICGVSQAIDIVMTGNLFTGTYAYEIGWADLITPKKKSHETAVRLIKFISDNYTKFDAEKTAYYAEKFIKSEGGES